MCNVSIDRITKKKNPEKIKKSKNVSNDDEKYSMDTFWLYCLGTYSRSASTEMWIQCVASNLREKLGKNTLTAVPNLMKNVRIYDQQTTLFILVAVVNFSTLSLRYILMMARIRG